MKISLLLTGCLTVCAMEPNKAKAFRNCNLEGYSIYRGKFCKPSAKVICLSEIKAKLPKYKIVNDNSSTPASRENVEDRCTIFFNNTHHPKLIFFALVILSYIIFSNI